MTDNLTRATLDWDRLPLWPIFPTMMVGELYEAVKLVHGRWWSLLAWAAGALGSMTLWRWRLKAWADR